MTQCFATGIRWSGASLGELILERQDLRICRLAEAAPEFPDHPAAALEQAGRRALWDPGDLGWMRGFARGLGVSDTQGQLEHLRLYQDLLESRLRAAVETAQRKCRLYVALGLFGGTLLGLVLL